MSIILHYTQSEYVNILSLIGINGHSEEEVCTGNGYKIYRRRDFLQHPLCCLYYHQSMLVSVTADVVSTCIRSPP